MPRLTLDVEGLKTVLIEKIVKLPGKVKSSSREPGNEYFWTYPDSFDAKEAGPVLQIRKAPNGTHTVELTVKNRNKEQTAKVEVIVEVPADPLTPPSAQEQ